MLRLAALAIILLYAVANEGVSSLTLKTATRNLQETSIEFKVEFDSPNRPQARWFKYAENGKTEIYSWVSYYDGQGYTVAYVEFDAGEIPSDIYLEIGDFQKQFFKLWLIVESSYLKEDLNTKRTEISSFDVAYPPGSDATVDITAYKKMYDAAEPRDNYLYGLYGIFLHADTGELEQNEYGGFDSIQDQSQDLGDKVKTTLTFLTKDASLNGWLQGQFFSNPPWPRPSNLLVGEVTDVFWLIVHENTNSGPFPDNFVSLKPGYGPSTTVCVPGDTWRCSINCEVNANDVASLKIYKLDNGARKEMDTDLYLRRYNGAAEATLDMSQAFAGDYECVAADSTGRETVLPLQVLGQQERR